MNELSHSEFTGFSLKPLMRRDWQSCSAIGALWSNGIQVSLKAISMKQMETVGSKEYITIRVINSTNWAHCISIIWVDIGIKSNFKSWQCCMLIESFLIFLCIDSVLSRNSSVFSGYSFYSEFFFNFNFKVFFLFNQAKNFSH